MTDDPPRTGAAQERPDGQADERPPGEAAVPAEGRGGDTDAASPARRRRRWLVAGVSLAAALVVIALCVGGAAALSALDRFSEQRADGRYDTRGRETACLELERRLNRVSPPGAAPDPARRAAAIRDENAALRPYLSEVEVRGIRDEHLAWWRQLLDARTTYAEALDRQVSARTPAFYLAPRSPDGATVADRLLRRSPTACGGAIRRLAAPDL